jgi:hypothetical protein
VNSSVIGKIEKARLYARERTRMRVSELKVAFHGENGDHEVTLRDDTWHCTCDFYATGHGACAHTMALERVLEGMLTPNLVSGHMLQPA